jgi:hypothetical protein
MDQWRVSKKSGQGHFNPAFLFLIFFSIFLEDFRPTSEKENIFHSLVFILGTIGDSGGF